MRRSTSPLLRRAPVRHAADRAWTSLVVAAFLLLTLATASAPLVVEAAQNAAVVRVLGAVPDAAVLRQSPVVRITGGTSDALAAGRQAEALSQVEGLARPQVLGVSFGDELASAGARWRSSVARADDPDAEGLDRRLAAVDDPAAALVVVAGPAEGGRVWLDEAAAAEAGAGPGDEVRVTVATTDGGGSVVLAVAGVYALSEDGLRPADVEGSTSWLDRAGRLPQSAGSSSQDPPLLTDVATLQEVEEPLGEQVLWSVEAGLDPAVPTLRQLSATARGVERLPRQLPPLTNQEGPVGRFIVAGGIPGVQEVSAGIATAAVARTRGVAWSAVALAALTVLVVTVAGDARRGHERRLEVAMGLHPLQVGGLRVLEVLPSALVAGVAGVGLAWVVVTLAGPEGSTSAAGLAAAALDGATAVAAGLLLVAAVSAVSSWLTARLVRSAAGGPARSFPWRVCLGAATVATVVGVVTGGGTRGLDVVAPLLVAASTGALAAVLAVLLLRRLVADRPARAARRARTGLTARQARRVLARRRAVAPGRGHDVVVVLLTCGLAMAGYVVLADRTVQEAVESKAAVLGGAATVVALPDDTAPRLDPDARPMPSGPADGQVSDMQGRPFDLDLDPPADAPLPRGDTLVWKERVAVPGEQQLRMLVLDTETAPDALLFGRSSEELEQARRGLERLRAVASTRRGDRVGVDPSPVLLVGDRAGLALGDVVEVRGTTGLLPVEVVATAPVFPGQGASDTLVVADTDTYLAAMQAEDPRFVRPEGAPPLVLQAEYWSSRGAGDVTRLVESAGVPVEEVQTAGSRRLQPSFVAADLVQGYQLAVAALLVVVGVVGMALQSDRNADRALPSAVVLRRTALGRAGVRRALLAEHVGVVVVSVAAAAVSLLVLVPLAPFLLDPAPGLLPLLDVGPWSALLGLLVVLATSLLPTASAGAATAGRLRGAREEVVLRDDR